MKVLIIQQKMIGDVLTSSILFEALRDQYPKAELHFVVNTHTYPVIENHPCIDKVHFFTPEIERSSLKLLTFARLLRKERYDAIIDVYSKLSSALITLISGAKIRVSKHKYYTSFVYTHTFKEKLSAKTNAGLAIENRLQLLEPLIGKRDPIKPKIYLTKEELEAAKSLLLNNKIALERPIFMIGVLGSGLNKTYPFMEMAKFIDTIVEEIPHAQILFNYIPKQKEEAQAIYDLCLPVTQDNIFFDVFGKGLRAFFALTSYCTALVGNEGGAINMAKALNIPTFSIFSPWISNEDWNIYEDGQRFSSVHLRDFKPELYKEAKHPKKLKKQAFELYEIFKFELIKPVLITYLEQFKNS